MTVADKKVMCVRGEDGETIERSVPEEKRHERVLSDEEIHRLLELGERRRRPLREAAGRGVGRLRGEVYMLQSRPITTIDDPEGSAGSANEAESQPPGAKSGVADGGAMESQSEAVRLSGIGSAPGRVTGAPASSPNSTTSTKWPRATSSSPR